MYVHTQGNLVIRHASKLLPLAYLGNKLQVAIPRGLGDGDLDRMLMGGVDGLRYRLPELPSTGL